MKNILITIIAIRLLSSCSGFLDEKPDSSITHPNTYADLQALLDALNSINTSRFPSLLEIGTDNYFVPDDALNSVTDFERDNYLWQKEPLYQNINRNVEWMAPSVPVMYANIVLDEIENMPASGKADDKKVRSELIASARFIRAFSFFNFAQVYAPAYDLDLDNPDLGIVMRLNADFNVPSKRSSVRATYDQIRSDLVLAVRDLPSKPLVTTRPGKAAGFALLARTALIMQDVESALLYADTALFYQSELIDYNHVSATATAPFPRFNAETVYFASSSGASILHPQTARIDSNLYESYAVNDLRKVLFFKLNNDGYYSFKGSYLGESSGSFFTGISTAEIYLIKAECEVRLQQMDEANHTINLFLKNRVNKDSFQPYDLREMTDPIGFVLKERRKELIMRGLRWSDLKRLNVSGTHAISLIRSFNQHVYTLAPNDLRYNFLIPQPIIEFTGIPQNKR
ncbi:RagB/SusD family nutrient uptake outer membrane protein [Sphingobacterium paucimobilis]|uniref:RagB/SusD domain-containing protein n=1 Tax=Sphingobacterium paucimobilis HER1398 TaxID=1346330 RepID=U2HVN2_9SPHI|nr:RagB/SusD family nutrient uptake outer membrane protein [Sphingobacterium paucimobilis]ERJ59335.1 hypothetical protein M472_11175 [Sphingobacterium paucimobilis HER1398]